MSRSVSVSGRVYKQLTAAASKQKVSVAALVDQMVEGGLPQQRFPRRGKNAVPADEAQAYGLGLACAAWLIRKHLAIVSPDCESPAAAAESV